MTWWAFGRIFPRVRRINSEVEPFGPTGFAVEYRLGSVLCYWGTQDKKQHFTEEDLVMIMDISV